MRAAVLILLASLAGCATPDPIAETSPRDWQAGDWWEFETEQGRFTIHLDEASVDSPIGRLDGLRATISFQGEANWMLFDGDHVVARGQRSTFNGEPASTFAWSDAPCQWPSGNGLCAVAEVVVSDRVQSFDIRAWTQNTTTDGESAWLHNPRGFAGASTQPEVYVWNDQACAPEGVVFGFGNLTLMAGACQATGWSQGARPPVAELSVPDAWNGPITLACEQGDLALGAPPVYTPLAADPCEWTVEPPGLVAKKIVGATANLVWDPLDPFAVGLVTLEAFGQETSGLQPPLQITSGGGVSAADLRPNVRVDGAWLGAVHRVEVSLDPATPAQYLAALDE